jgi:hypothetical protein
MLILLRNGGGKIQYLKVKEEKKQFSGSSEFCQV